MQLTEAYRRLGRLDSALKVVEELLRRMPQEGTAMVVRVDLLLSLQRQAEALAALQDLEKLSSSVLEARLAARIGQLGLKYPNCIDAEKWFLLSERLDGSDPAPQIYRARHAYSKRNLEVAKTRWMELLNNGSKKIDRYECHQTLANIANFQQNREVAIHHYSLAIRQPKARPEAFHSLVSLLVKPDRFEDAREVLGHYRSIGPDPVEVLLLEAVITEAQGDLSNTESRLESAVECRPDHLGAWLALGEFTERRGTTDAAISIWERAATNLPRHTEPLVRLLKTAAAEGRSFAEQRALCSRILSVNPTHSYGLITHANICRQTGERKEALDSYLRGAELYPKSINFWTNAIAIMMSEDRLAEAHETANKAASHLSAQQPSDCIAVARGYFSAELYDKACEWVSKALEVDAQHQSAHAYMAHIHCHIGDYRAAWPHVQLARQLDPRDYAVAGLAARCSAAVRASTSGGDDAVPVRPTEPFMVPDELFGALERWSTGSVADSSNRVTLVSGSLGPGGAERQVAFTLQGLKGLNHSFGCRSRTDRSVKSPYRKDDNVVGRYDRLGIGLRDKPPSGIESPTLYERAEGQDGLTTLVAPAHPRAFHALRHQRLARRLNDA